MGNESKREGGGDSFVVMMPSCACSAGGQSEISLVDEWLFVDSEGQTRVCRPNDVLHKCGTLAEASEFMQKAADTIRETTRSWSVKTGEGWYVNRIVLRCGLSKYTTSGKRDADGKFIQKKRGRSGDGRRKGTPKQYTSSRRHFNCRAVLELKIIDNEKSKARVGYNNTRVCRKCGQWKRQVNRHELKCPGKLPAEVYVCQRPNCRKKIKNIPRARRAHERWCAVNSVGYQVVVAKACAHHTDHKHLYTRQASMSIAPLQKAYLQAIGGRPSAETRRTALDAVMELDPSVLATMQMGYNIEASLRRANGISSGVDTATEVTAKFVAALSVCTDVSFVIKGTNESGAPFSIMKMAGSDLVVFCASHNFRREYEWIFDEQRRRASTVGAEATGHTAADSLRCDSAAAAAVPLDSEAICKRDNRVQLDEVDHTYSVDGSSELWTSVTSLVQRNFNREAAARAQAKIRGVHIDVVLDEWEQAEAAGTALHKRIELRLNGQSIGVLRDVGEEEEWEQVESFLKTVETDNWTLYRTEWKIFDENLYLAGTCDAVFLSSTGKYVLVEWKRVLNVTPAKQTEWAEQLHLYKHILEAYVGRMHV